MKRVTVVLMGLLASCGMRAEFTPACQSDDQCPTGQLCFAEGCGDPGVGVAVEVSGGTLTTHPVQDFSIADGSLTKAQDFDLGVPLSVNGEFLREKTSFPNPADRSTYSEAVTVRAVGKSVVLPGITRTVETRFERPERGYYELKLPSGEFTLSAVALDRSVPPVTLGATVQPGKMPASASFVFPAVDAAPALTGQLIKTTDPTLLPPEPVLLSASFPIDLQVLDVATNQPLSQRFSISRDGYFSLAVSPDARNRSELILVASPRDTGVPVPTKRFSLSTPLPTAISLEYGNFGEAGNVTGTIVDSQGVAVGDAQVLLDGTVKGDGSFRTRIAVTDADGHFTLNTLPSRGEGTFTLYVAPSRSSRAAATRVAATVKVENGVATLTPSTVKLDDRLIVRGRVLRPGSTLGAGGVAVRATVQNVTSANTVEPSPLALEPAETMTDADGNFTLPLDEGVWRFEYYPGEQAPLSSRLLTIKADRDDTGMPLPELTLRDVQLSHGRTVTGVVTATTGLRTGQAVPFAQLRFFRVTKVEGKDTSILLGTAVADERGMYRVVLPAVSTTAQ